MPRLRLIGRVLPSARILTISNYPRLTFPATEIGLDLTFNVQIQDNIITVDCDANKWSKADHLMPIYMRAVDIVRAAVDLVCFATGDGLTVILETLIEPDGTQTHIVPQQPELAALGTALTTRPDGYSRLLPLVLRNITLIHALRDLIDAVTQVHISPRACGRVLDGLRQIMAPDDPPNRGWDKVRRSLQIDRPYLQMVTDQSVGPRHADPAHIPGDVTHELTKRTWTIMNRYFEFILRGGTEPLPTSEFPLLAK